MSRDFSRYDFTKFDPTQKYNLYIDCDTIAYACAAACSKDPCVVTHKASGRKKEFENLRSQIGTSSWGGTRYMPMAFTEQGVAMLSSVLNSKTAIEVNIRIIRVFTKIREYALTHSEILLQLSKLEKEVKGNSKDIENIFAVLKELIEKDAKPAPRNKIGFNRHD